VDIQAFFVGIESKVAAGVRVEEVGYQLQFSKQELRKVVKEYSGREVCLCWPKKLAGVWSCNHWYSRLLCLTAVSKLERSCLTELRTEEVTVMLYYFQLSFFAQQDILQWWSQDSFSCLGLSSISTLVCLVLALYWASVCCLGCVMSAFVSHSWMLTLCILSAPFAHLQYQLCWPYVQSKLDYCSPTSNTN